MRPWCLSVSASYPMEELIANITAAVHGTYMANTWDFYKPDLSAEYVCAVISLYILSH